MSIDMYPFLPSLFTDEVANLQRRNVDLQTKLHAAIQQNQISQVTLATNDAICNASPLIRFPSCL